MDHLKKLNDQIRNQTFLVLFSGNLLIVIGWLAADTFFSFDSVLVAIAFCIVGVLLSTALSVYITNYALEPLKALWQAILHVAPTHSHAPAPNLEAVKTGRELVTSLALEVYQLASTVPHTNAKAKSTDEEPLLSSIAANLPLPLLAISKSQEILFANEPALRYFSLAKSDIVGSNFYSAIDMSFPNERTYDSWLADCRANKVTDARTWERVRLKLQSSPTRKQLDLAAAYNKALPGGVETVVMFFDRTASYEKDDQAMSYVALAVHELRTPLTVLRGYIEVFEDELGASLNPELKDFMHKMNVSAQQLAAFVNNILNVARVDENQLVLQLTEDNWEEILRSALDSLRLRAQVHGKTIEVNIPPALPRVAVDRVSIHEVINNLVDNAIKYSNTGQKITVSTRQRTDGMIETTVQDSGVGIPESSMQNLFEKFYRNHRNRSQIGGTGLGLYLSKAIITAHGGEVWAQSKEGQGSTFGFTLLPYDKLAEEKKNSNNKDIVRGAHGWIKNHSLYRR